MKNIAIPMIACLALASSAFAGQEVKETKETKAVVEPCFKDQELQLEIFGSWSSINDTHDHDRVRDGRPVQGFGGGVGANYYFMRYLGVGVDADVSAARRGLWDFTGELYARYPIEGTICWAPYAFTGGGFQCDGVNAGIWNVGGGLEWRATHHIGVFAEGRYTWAGSHEEDNVRVTMGVKFIF